MSCHLSVGRLEFSPEDVARTVRDRRLLAIEVELGRAGGLAVAGARAAITQACDLGARKLAVRGAEPLSSPEALGILVHGCEQRMEVEVFTNGSGLDRATAERLFALGVQVVLRRDSSVPEIQDQLAGLPGAQQVIAAAYRNLRDAGYPSGERRLGISSVICRLNQAEILGLWQWSRGEGLVPYVELIQPHDGVPGWEALALSPHEYQDTLEQLAAWDHEHGGPAWDPQAPFVDKRCQRHRVSCVVDAEGRVLPCAGLRIPIGNIHERSLREILDDSEVMENLRDDEHAITGPCAACRLGEGCHGCRGSAFAETGDYLASDPRCWHNRDRQHEIARLPLVAAPLIPQGDPMRLVDTLRSVGERIATAGVTVRAEMPFVDEAGVLSAAAYLEMMAQAAAAMAGFGKRGRGEREAGLMLGTRNLEILGEARIGDELEIEVCKSARLGGFGIVQGCVRRQADVLARGEIKILQLGTPEAS